MLKLDKATKQARQAHNGHIWDPEPQRSRGTPDPNNRQSAHGEDNNLLGGTNGHRQVKPSSSDGREAQGKKPQLRLLSFGTI